MSKKCELTGKIPMKGHNVSHANNKTKRRFLPNLKKVKFTSELTCKSNFFKIWQESSFSFVVSMTNIMTFHRNFTSKFTFF